MPEKNKKSKKEKTRILSSLRRYLEQQSIRTDQIGDAIKLLVDSYELTPENEIDYDKYNSEDPYIQVWIF